MIALSGQSGNGFLPPPPSESLVENEDDDDNSTKEDNGSKGGNWGNRFDDRPSVLDVERLLQMETTDRPFFFDIERLLQMERDVLGPNDHHTYTEMREWINQRPYEQFVLLELSTNNVVSYCLTLRVSGVNRLGTLSFDELKKESARNPEGPVLVIVRLVSYRSEGVVLDAVLEKAKRLPGVESVVAMARCTDVPDDVEDNGHYEQYVRTKIDPGITCHTSRLGVIDRVVPRWNPSDTDNGGCGVLIVYRWCDSLLLSACNRVCHPDAGVGSGRIPPPSLDVLRVAFGQSVLWSNAEHPQVIWPLEADDHIALLDACQEVHETRGTRWPSVESLREAVENSCLMYRLHA